MSNPNRSALINTLFKVLAANYHACEPPADRTLFEHLMYAFCLEDARAEAADEAFARLQQTFFDWNEVRVTTVSELAETLASLPDPPAAAKRLKHALQHIFESHYSFDIEAIKKQNLGKAIKDIEVIRGVTPFVVAYVTQHGLGGHAIPMSTSIVDLLVVIGIVTEAEARRNRIPGLERAVPKAKGIEFASLLQQIAADFKLMPDNSRLRTLLLQIDPEAKDRLAKRLTRSGAPPVEDDKQALPAASQGNEDEQPPAAGLPKEPRKGTRKEVDKSGDRDASGGRRKRRATPSAGKRAKADAQPALEADAVARKASATKQLSKKKPR